MRRTIWTIQDNELLSPGNHRMTNGVVNTPANDRNVIVDAISGQTVTTNSTVTNNSSSKYKPTTMLDEVRTAPEFDSSRNRFPYCIVWTPLPLLTWLFPLIGHMGIAYSSGVIRDFAGPYHVSEDRMAFGDPTKYWILDPDLAQGGRAGWDRAIYEASEEYKTRMHNIFCDNCHSHCAYALNVMNYKGSKSWNMVWLALYMIAFGKYVSFTAFLKTWAPFLVFLTLVLVLSLWRF